MKRAIVASGRIQGEEMTVCGRCRQPVFYAEQVLALGQHWHLQCLLCSSADCGKRLDSRTCSEHDGQPYCTHCYKRLFGPKGYGYGIGAGTLSVPDQSNNNNGHHVGNGFASYRHLDPAVSSISYSQHAGKPRFIDDVDERFVEKKTNKDEKSANGVVVKARPCAAGLGERDRQNCSKCQGRVYEAEKMLAAGAACFVCTECSRRLESRTLSERAGLLYCTEACLDELSTLDDPVSGCYARLFGPKGYGHGIGAGVLQLHQ